MYNSSAVSSGLSSTDQHGQAEQQCVGLSALLLLSLVLNCWRNKHHGFQYGQRVEWWCSLECKCQFTLRQLGSTSKVSILMLPWTYLAGFSLQRLLELPLRIRCSDTGIRKQCRPKYRYQRDSCFPPLATSSMQYFLFCQCRRYLQLWLLPGF